MSLDSVQLSQCKLVTTFDSLHLENGFLVELAKDGTRTPAYITSILPGRQKGYHLHRRRCCNFVVLRGDVRITLVDGSHWRSFELSARCFERLHVPPGIALALKNIGDQEAWIFNYSDPPYDPAEVNEQVEYSPNEVEQQLVAVH